MSDTKELFVVIVGCFAAVGLALGVVGFLSADIAQSRFLDPAGQGVEQFGSFAVDIVHFGLLVTVLFGAPVLAAVLGVLAGARLHDRGASIAVGGGGALVGVVVLAVLSVTLTNQGTTAGTAPLFSQPLLFATATTMTAATGGIAGLLGSLLY